jgi:(p)ppGpp synthase/HD superfamily hydrolase
MKLKELIKINSVNDAIEFIKKAHEGQIDKSGKPYWQHPLSVMKRLPKEATYDVIIAALLHDVLEDTDYTESDLRELGVSQNSINMIKILTRNRDKTYSEFIKDIASSKNKGAIMIKIADNEDNLDPSRILPKEYDGLRDRYKKSIEVLKKET